MVRSLWTTANVTAFRGFRLAFVRFFVLFAMISAAGCEQSQSPIESPTANEIQTTEPSPNDPFATRREQMVEKQLRGRDIDNVELLAAMTRVPRHEFVPDRDRERAYEDHPLPIGHRQTISQPYIVALMTQLIEPEAQFRVLEIGTGCGYQAAVLAELVKEVYSIEIVEPLASEARERLTRLRYSNVTVRSGDGYQGWPEHAPFDAILVTAAPDHIPQPLVEQLAPGGKMVIPVGAFSQELLLLEKLPDGQIKKSTMAPVAFVPMTGEAQVRGER